MAFRRIPVPGAPVVSSIFPTTDKFALGEPA